jgi:hypothetical protein
MTTHETPQNAPLKAEMPDVVYLQKANPALCRWIADKYIPEGKHEKYIRADLALTASIDTIRSMIVGEEKPDQGYDVDWSWIEKFEDDCAGYDEIEYEDTIGVSGKAAWELLNLAKIGQELNKRIQFNPDWMQCSEDAKRIYGEIREEYGETIKSQAEEIERLKSALATSVEKDPIESTTTKDNAW